MNQPTMIFRQKTPHQTRCDKCHKPIHEFYTVDLGQFRYHFCSIMHANEAKKNYDEKIEKGISPVNLDPITDEEIEEEEDV